jgi:hypothetical protein
MAGVVFRADADALAERLLGVETPGRNEPETAQVSEKA